MPQQIFYPNAGLAAILGAQVEAITGGKCRLFKSGFSPNITTTAGELITHEANFTGYPTGGLEDISWAGPYLAPEGGMSIQSIPITFNTGSPTTVPNSIGGYWYEDVSGVAIVVCEFAEPVPMQVPMQVLNIQIRLINPN